MVSNAPGPSSLRMLVNHCMYAWSCPLTYPSSGCPANPSKPVAYPNATQQEPRIVANFADQNNHTQSEDCLTLNIWSKSTSQSHKPVLVYFHGGSMYGL